MMPHTREDQHETGLGTRPLVAQQGNESENVDDTFPYIQYLQEQQMADGWKEFFRDDNKGPDNEVVDATLKMVTPTLGETDERLLEMAREMWTAPVELRTDYENRMTETRYRPILNEIIEAAYDLGIPAVRPIELATSTDISCTPMVGAAEIFVELLELGGAGGPTPGGGRVRRTESAPQTVPKMLRFVVYLVKSGQHEAFDVAKCFASDASNRFAYNQLKSR
jgi:hypothetical protein